MRKLGTKWSKITKKSQDGDETNRCTELNYDFRCADCLFGRLIFFGRGGLSAAYVPMCTCADTCCVLPMGRGCVRDSK